LKWDALIRENRDDIAKIVTYETGKPLAESQGELDYALGFTCGLLVKPRGSKAQSLHPQHPAVVFSPSNNPLVLP